MSAEIGSFLSASVADQKARDCSMASVEVSYLGLL